jgi:hypothetical protein
MIRDTITVFEINKFKIYEFKEEERDLFYDLNKEFNVIYVYDLFNLKDLISEKNIKKLK